MVPKGRPPGKRSTPARPAAVTMLVEAVVPELVHSCGKRVTFPSGTEGRRGKCPHCGERVLVPGEAGRPAQRTIHLDPPPQWDAYLAYLEDRGPPPREFVLPSKLMLKADADQRWEQQATSRPSRFRCPSCRERLQVDQIVCTECGLDLRSGRLTTGKGKLNAKGMAYLAKIPWLNGEGGTAPAPDREPDRERPAAPRPRRSRSRRSR